MPSKLQGIGWESEGYIINFILFLKSDLELVSDTNSSLIANKSAKLNLALYGFWIII